MNKVLEKQQLKYVLATLEQPTRYIKSLHFGKYLLTDDIENATKTMSIKIAKELVDLYVHDTGNTEIVVLPVVITYELVNET